MPPPPSETRIVLLGRPDRCTFVEDLRKEVGFEVDLHSPDKVLGDHVAPSLADKDVCLIDAGIFCEEERARLVQEVLGVLLSEHGRLRPIVLVPEEDPESFSAAAESQAWDVLSLPSESDELASRIRRAALLGRLMRDAPVADPEPPSAVQAEPPRGMPLGPGPEDEAWGIIGASARMQRVFEQIEQVAASDVPVLVTGESGTGKELVAEAIRRRSKRCDGPFVPINCGAIPETLLEAELFGHEKGAFTGATRARRGRVEAAHEGTLFLDEIGELAPLLQVKLLRFLEDHKVERVGGRKPIDLDVRVIAATNRDLQEAVSDASFREDLYYRLAVFSLEMPPLREREEDVLLLASFYLERYAAEAGRPRQRFSEDAREALLRYSWPGNVRELINRVRRAVVVAEGSEVTQGDLGLADSETDSGRSCLLREARRDAEIECIRTALRRAHWNKSEAARLLDVSRTQLYELIRRHEISDHEVS